jgi:hypothetical protein
MRAGRLKKETLEKIVKAVELDMLITSAGPRILKHYLPTGADNPLYSAHIFQAPSSTGHSSAHSATPSVGAGGERDADAAGGPVPVEPEVMAAPATLLSTTTTTTTTTGTPTPTTIGSVPASDKGRSMSELPRTFAPGDALAAAEAPIAAVTTTTASSTIPAPASPSSNGGSLSAQLSEASLAAEDLLARPDSPRDASMSVGGSGSSSSSDSNSTLHATRKESWQRSYEHIDADWSMRAVGGGAVPCKVSWGE